MDKTIPTTFDMNVENVFSSLIREIENIFVESSKSNDKENVASSHQKRSRMKTKKHHF